MQPYNDQFFEGNSGWARSAAHEIAPLVIDMIKPQSLIDVGCGAGTWLSVFGKFGVQDLWGVDGDYVQRERLEIPAERFISHDLTQPFKLDRQFDLVVSLEVAEHLPEAGAQSFVQSLTKLGPVILFSAAIPGQGGVHHINEQWQDYWAAIFRAQGYEPIDWLRKRIWRNERVEWYYAQNMLMYARPEYIESHPRLKIEQELTSTDQLRIVHPVQYIETMTWTSNICQSIEDLARLIPFDRSLIMVDEAQLEGTVTAGRRAIPFPEAEGYYGGPPDDDDSALAEFKRLRAAGAEFIVFAWPAFWWLEHYPALHRELRTNHPCILENERLIVFELI
jgi:SAM-dependent methyltransferase